MNEEPSRRLNFDVVLYAVVLQYCFFVFVDY